MARNLSLLEQAKSTKPHGNLLSKTKFTNDDIELVAAWVEGDVTPAQIRKVKKFSATSYAYNYIALVLRQALNSKNGNTNGREK
jgi:hypothetical protein